MKPPRSFLKELEVLALVGLAALVVGAVRNLRVIGLLLLLGLSTTIREGWAHGILTATVSPYRWSVTAQLPLAWLFGGFLCFAIAEMVNRGRIMRDELASVI
jgi:hypothetical protein